MVVGLKNNCTSLLEAAKQCFIDFADRISEFEFTDNRQIRRQTSYLEVGPDSLPPQWKTISALAMVRRVGIRYKDKKKSNKKKKAASKSNKATKKVAGGVSMAEIKSEKPPLLTKSGKHRVANAVHFDQTAYYAIVKPVGNVQKVAQMIQNHWNIENKLHRNKDVVLNEDNNRIKNKSVANNLSTIFNFVINTCVLHGIKSLTIAIENYANQSVALFDLIAKTSGYKVKIE